MNPCKAEMDFCGNVNMVNETMSLSMEYFQRYQADASTKNKSAWVIHFPKERVMSDITSFVFSVLGRMYGNCAVPYNDGIWTEPYFLDIEALSLKYITTDFTKDLTWNGYDALNKTLVTTISPWRRLSANGQFAIADVPVTTYDSFAAVSINAFGAAFETSTSGGLGDISDIVFYHPEIYSGNPLLISRNYLLSNAVLTTTL